MAGIGFALRRLYQGNDLKGVVLAFYNAAFISSGPWLMTVVALVTINWLIATPLSLGNLELFRTILIYNFAFSLTLTSPIIFLTTRHLSDQIYLKNVEDAPGLLIGSLTLAFVVEGTIAAAFYGLIPDMPPELRVLCVINYLAVVALWQVTVFLSALKDFKTVTFAFAVGLGLAVFAAVMLGYNGGTLGLVGGFTIGICTTVFVIIARIFAEYPYPIMHPYAFLASAKTYWELPVVGLLYTAGIWIDKWVMWFAPDHLLTAGGLPTYPVYDVAMFLASLTIVPSLALFTLAIETRFFDRYVSYYRCIQSHGSYAQVLECHSSIVETLKNSFRNLIVLQGCITYVAIVSAPSLFAAFDIAFTHIGAYRLGVLGILFHALLLFAIIVLAYFDLRRDLLSVSAVFLVTNGIFTAVTMTMGFPYYGYGYFLACVVSACFGLCLAWRRVRDLPYLTFVVCNPSVTRRTTPHALAK